MPVINKPDFKKGDLLYNPLFSLAEAREKGFIYEFIEWGKTYSDWISIFLKDTQTNKKGEYGYSSPRSFIKVEEVNLNTAVKNHNQEEYFLALIVDANFKKNRFAVCAAHGAPLWYGSFFSEEAPKNQADAELKAALKAVWLAGKIKERMRINNLNLTLFTDAEYLKYQDNKRQKGYALQWFSRLARLCRS